MPPKIATLIVARLMDAWVGEWKGTLDGRVATLYTIYEKSLYFKEMLKSASQEPHKELVIHTATAARVWLTHRPPLTTPRKNNFYSSFFRS